MKVEAPAFPRVEIAGENAVMVYLGDAICPAVAARVRQLDQRLREQLGDKVIDTVPSYASVLVLYQADRIHFEALRKLVVDCGKGLNESVSDDVGRHITLPVWYGVEAGADLAMLAEAAGLTPEAVVERHQGRDYYVYAIGFAPGFAFMGEVDASIARPRLATPRRAVPWGAVGIADRQTAVYPAVSPGGWNLIGRCPVRMFDPAAAEPMRVQVGDRVRFESVSHAEYLELGGTP